MLKSMGRSPCDRLCRVIVLALDVVRCATRFEFDFVRHHALQDGANVDAEVAADAFVGNRRFARLRVEFDRLVTGVEARNGTTTATDAFVVVDLRNDLEIAIEVFGRDDIGQCHPDEIAKRRKSVLFHENGQAFFHIFHDAITVLHDGCRHLEVFGAQQ